MTVLNETKAPALEATPLLEQQQKKPKKKSTDQAALDELKGLSRYFSQLIDTIPPKVYFHKSEEILDKIEMNKRALFEDSDLSAKAKNKRIKLDPNAHQKISDIATAFYDKKKTDGKMGELRKKLAKRIKELRQARGASESGKSTRTNSESSQNSPSKNKDKSDASEKLPKIYNKDGNLVFSKFDFASQVDLAADQKMEKSKKKKDTLKGLLVKAKKEDVKIAKLEKTNAQAAGKMKEKKMWKSALEKCEGNKVRDNPKLIEKALKQKGKTKVKHAKAWAERKKGVEARAQKKQEKRQRHINERIDQKKEKKMKFLKKKGRIPA